MSKNDLIAQQMNRSLFHAATALLMLIIPQLLSRAPQQSAGPLTTSPLLPSSSQQQRTAYLPILVYHHVRRSSPTDPRKLQKLTVSPEIFEEQMKYLQDNGYHVVSFENLEDYLEQRLNLPRRSVIISFDDGSEDQYVNAVPILKTYHYSATFFVVTNFVDNQGFLSLDQLRALKMIGMCIGSHSRSHLRLDRITSPTVLWDEIYGSKKLLEAELSAPVTEFAYPYGRYNAAVVAMVRRAGYKAARAFYFGTLHSRNDVYVLSAIMAPGDLATFARIVSKPRGLRRAQPPGAGGASGGPTEPR